MWSKALAVVAGICGVLGALCNAKASGHILNVTPDHQALDLTAEAARRARSWSVAGWAFIVGAAFFGTTAALIA